MGVPESEWHHGPHAASLPSPRHSLPNTPPNYDAAPNHSGGRGPVLTLKLQDLGEGAWNITVPESHKGLVLKADIDGSWERPGSGYRARSFGSSSCITHSSRGNKGPNSFVFRSGSGKAPKVAGFLVKGYSRQFNPLRS